MSEHLHYVPILKAKRGEFQALESIKEEDKPKFTPLIEIPPIPWNFIDETHSKEIDEYIEPFPGMIKRFWGDGYPVYIDLLVDEEHHELDDGSHTFEHLCRELENEEIKYVPVTYLDRSSEFQDVVRQICSEDESVMCLRIQVQDFDDENLVKNIEDFLGGMQKSKDRIDLILDFESIPSGKHSVFSMALKGMLISIPDLNDWRSITLASSSFPENLSDFGRDVVGKIDRSDWLLWKGLISNPSSIERLPRFGDYTISNPKITELDPRIMQASASIRYTAEDYWLIVKGKGVRLSGFSQYRDLCQKLIKMSEYKGPDFSWGDGFINQCAEEGSKTGNLTTWRQVGTNHHIMLVLHQIANLDGS